MVMKKQNFPETIPVFPLPGALLLPRSHLPLHLFEPRYLAMMDDVLKTEDRLIGMVQPFEAQGEPDQGKPVLLHRVGCAGRLTSFTETEDGRYMVTLSGVSRFRISEEVEGFTPYRRCRVAWDDYTRDRGAAEKDQSFDRTAFLDTLGRFFDDQGLKTDWESLTEAEDELLINSLSMLCPFDPEDKQALLEAQTLTTRRETLTTLIEFALRGGSAEERMQ